MVALGCGVSFAANDAASNGVTHYINPVSNPYSPAFGHPYRHGVIPTREVHEQMMAWAHAHGPNGEFVQPSPHFASNQPTATAGKLAYGGGVNGVGVMSGPNDVYLIFYGTQWGTAGTDANGYTTFSNDTYGAAVAAQKFFKGIGTNNETYQADLTQWCEGIASGSSTCPTSGGSWVPYQTNILKGVWYDNAAASPAQATGTQLANEAVKGVTHFGLSGTNRYRYFVVLSPPGTNPDNYKSPTQGYCAWHDYTGDGYGVSPTDIPFSNQPYNIDVGASCGTNFVNTGTAGMLDGYMMTLGHEWHEMMSDVFPAGGWTNHTGGTLNGQENSDECAWLAPGTAGGAANVTFATGTFAEQASWSNDTGNCALTHAILTHGGGGNVAPTANFSSVTSGLTATFSNSSTDSDGTIASSSWTFGDGGTSTTSSPSHTYAAAGTYTVTLTVTDNGGLTGTKSSSVTVNTTTSNVLQNGVGVTISGATNSQVNYTVVIPAGSANLNITLAGGTGDADEYVKFGAAPTLTTYDCRPYVSGNTESCPFASPQTGTYYVMVNGYAAYSGVTLKATWTAGGGNTAPTANFTFTTSNLVATFTDTSTDPQGNATITGHSWNFGDGGTSTATSPSHTYAAAGTYSVSETVTDSGGLSNTKTSSVTVSTASCGGTVLCSGVAVALPSVATGGVSGNYTMVVPAGKTSVVFNISGGTGDADLYVRLGAAPTTTTYSCRPYTSTNNETCTFNAPTAGTYYVNVRAYAAYSGVSLKGTITP